MDYQIGLENLISGSLAKLKMLFIPYEANDYRPQFLQSKLLLFSVVFLLGLKIITVGFFLPFPRNIFFADITKTDLVNILNQNRKNLGLKILSDNPVLDKAALLKAQDMIAKNYFSHQSPSGVSPWFWFKKVGYNYRYAGENLAVGFVDSDEVFRAWFNSPSHRENILNPNYKEVGTAILQGFGSDNTTLVVQIFGSAQAKAAPIKVAPNIPQTVSMKNLPENNLQNSQPLAQNVLGQESQANLPSGTAADNPPEIVDDSAVLESKVPDQKPRIIQSPEADAAPKNTFYRGFINFLVYDYEKLITYMSYAALMAISGSLLVNIFVNFNVQRGGIIFRSIVLAAIISLVLLLHQTPIYQVIPHNIVI